jgi:heavy metal translocating P-type ATPase
VEQSAVNEERKQFLPLHSHSKWRETHSIISLAQIIRRYPIPFFAILGLTSGAILQLGFGDPSLARWVWYATLVIGGAPIVWGTFRGMLRKHFASDVVAMLAIIAAILMDQAFAGVVVVLMQSGGEAVEDYGLRRASSSLDALLARAPKLARVLSDGILREIPVSEVTVGDTLVVRPGDLVPVDGTVILGSTEIDESALTGEPLPKTKSVGDRVLSGSVNTNLAFQMRADKPSSESQYAKIVELVRRAQEEKPPIQRLADHYAVYFTPITLAVCLLGFLVTKNPVTVLSVLVVATPCPLILATPIAVISGVNRAAKRGIIVKSGAALEQIGKARAVAFDKTGTITYGTPYVEEIITIDHHYTSDEILYNAACVGQLSSHVAARSVAGTALQRFSKLEVPMNFKETPGAGVEGTVGGKNVVIGSKRYIESLIGEELTGRLLQEVLGVTSYQGRLLTFVAISAKLAGVIVLGDQIRSGAPVMVQKLRDLGVEETVMLTGDNAENAQTIARSAGIQEVEANLLPGQKVEALQLLRQRFDPLVMVGDGINDAPALATATVGVAMGAHGAGISAEAADVVLIVDDVTAVADAVQIGQRMLKVAKQGIFLGLGFSFALMSIAAFGFIPPAIGAMLQEVIDASVVLNALRAR